MKDAKLVLTRVKAGKRHPVGTHGYEEAWSTFFVNFLGSLSSNSTPVTNIRVDSIGTNQQSM